MGYLKGYFTAPGVQFRCSYLTNLLIGQKSSERTQIKKKKKNLKEKENN